MCTVNDARNIIRKSIKSKQNKWRERLFVDLESFKNIIHCNIVYIRNICQEEQGEEEEILYRNRVNRKPEVAISNSST